MLPAHCKLHQELMSGITWTTPYLLATVVMASRGSGIQQPVLYNSTLQTVLTEKSNPLEVHITISPLCGECVPRSLSKNNLTDGFAFARLP